jgi:hypothetical protein
LERRFNLSGNVNRALIMTDVSGCRAGREQTDTEKEPISFRDFGLNRPVDPGCASALNHQQLRKDGREAGYRALPSSGCRVGLGARAAGR